MAPTGPVLWACQCPVSLCNSSQERVQWSRQALNPPRSVIGIMGIFQLCNSVNRYHISNMSLCQKKKDEARWDWKFRWRG